MRTERVVRNIHLTEDGGTIELCQGSHGEHIARLYVRGVKRGECGINVADRDLASGLALETLVPKGKEYERLRGLARDLATPA